MDQINKYNPLLHLNKWYKKVPYFFALPILEARAAEIRKIFHSFLGQMRIRKFISEIHWPASILVVRTTTAIRRISNIC